MIKVGDVWKWTVVGQGFSLTSNHTVLEIYEDTVTHSHICDVGGYRSGFCSIDEFIGDKVLIKRDGEHLVKWRKAVWPTDWNVVAYINEIEGVVPHDCYAGRIYGYNKETDKMLVYLDNEIHSVQDCYVIFQTVEPESV